MLSGGLATPANTRDHARSTIPPIPLLPLPHLPASTLLPAANLFSAALASSTVASSSASPRKAGLSPATARLADAFDMDDKPSMAKVARPGSIEERQQAMRDRVSCFPSTS